MTSLADHREEHTQRFHDQLINLQEEINRLRAKTFSANSYVQGQMNRMVTQLDKGIQQLTERLIKVAENGDRTVYSALENMQVAWGSLRGSIGDMLERARDKGEEATDQIQSKAGRLQDKAQRAAGELGDKAQRMAGDLGDKAQEVAGDISDTVQRGVNKARQAVNEQTQGSNQSGHTETTISAQAGKRPQQQGSGAQQMQDSGSQDNQQTQGVGASVTVTRTRSH